MIKQKRIIVLGATGSIGTSTLDVVRHDPERFKVVGLSANRSREALLALAGEFSVSRPVLSGETGEQDLLSMIRETDADIVVNGISGASGLQPSKAALESGKDLALANKETIVMAGHLVRSLARANGKNIIPVDSEHSAVFSLVNAFGPESVSEIILTASGGPFRTWDSDRIMKATPGDALRHPTWSMGSKITIDSASLANKGLEVIEAVRLFDVDVERVKVVVHPQSLVHSFVRTRDGVLYAQVSDPDMRHPIVSALLWPENEPNYLSPMTFDTAVAMEFEPPRYRDFPMLSLAYRCAALSGKYTIAFNAANEIAVAAFIEGSILFGEMSRLVADVLDRDWSGEPSGFEEVIEADGRARSLARNILGASKTGSEK